MNKKITSSVDNGTIEVTIKIKTNKYLSRYETKQSLDTLTQNIITSLCDTPYFGNYIHKIKVK